MEEDGSRVADPRKVAVVVDYAHFIAPRGESIHVSGELAQNLTGAELQHALDLHYDVGQGVIRARLAAAVSELAS